MGSIPTKGYSLLKEKFSLKGWFDINKITKNEAFYLRSQGFFCPMTSRTHKGRSKRYYVIEDKKILKVLQEYRDNPKK